MTLSKTTIAQLESLVRKLDTERQDHENAIAEIDLVFERLGMEAPRPKKGKRRPGRPKKSATRKLGKRRKRRKFKTTAAKLVLATVKKAGKNGATGAEITQA